MKIIPFNDPSRLYKIHEKQIMESFSTVAKSGYWLFGRYTESFSKDFSKFCGVKYCLPCANGSDALELALRSVLGSEKCGECEVITVANAGGYSSIACHLIGATPVYADIDAETLLLSLDSLKNCLSSRVKAVIVTHLFGVAVDVNKVRKVLNENGYPHVAIIEDCAQAHGAKIGDYRVGSLGDVATFSFYPTKNLGAMGDGGAIVTSNDEIYKSLKFLHQYGWDKKYRVQVPFGRNSRMDELQAAVLNSFLPFLDKNNSLRVSIYSRYKEAAPKSIRFLNCEKNDYVGHLAVVRTNKREKFVSYMRSVGVSVDIHYPILDTEQVGWRNFSNRKDVVNDLIASRKSVQEIVSLPCFPTMNEIEIETVCKALSSWEEE